VAAFVLLGNTDRFLNFSFLEATGDGRRELRDCLRAWLNAM